MITKEQFFDRVSHLPKTIVSKTKTASYEIYHLEDEILHFRRVNTNKMWQLNIRQLYDIYSTNSFINTTVIKKITKARVNSPSVAILIGTNCIDIIGNRIES